MTVVLATVVGGLLVANFDRQWRQPALGPVLLAVTVVGLYYTVPDNRELLAMMGAVLPLAGLGWPWRISSLGGAGSMAATGLLAWGIAFDGFGRQSAIVGGTACLGLMAIEPIVRWLRGSRGSPLARFPSGLSFAPLVAMVHLGLVVVAARVAGVRQPEAGRPGTELARGGVAEALAIVMVEVLIALAVGLIAPSAGRGKTAMTGTGHMKHRVRPPR
jgi:hypothetical protein